MPIGGYRPWLLHFLSPHIPAFELEEAVWTYFGRYSIKSYFFLYKLKMK